MSEFGTGKADEEPDQSVGATALKGDDTMDWSSCESSYDYDDAFSLTRFEKSTPQSPPFMAFSPNFSTEMEDPAPMFCPSIFSPSKLTSDSPVLPQRRHSEKSRMSKKFGFDSAQNSRLSPCMSNLQIISTTNFLSQEDKPYDFNESSTTASSTFIGNRRSFANIPPTESGASFENHTSSISWDENQFSQTEYVEDDEENGNLLGFYNVLPSPPLVGEKSSYSLVHDHDIPLIMTSEKSLTDNFVDVSTAHTTQDNLWSNRITPMNSEDRSHLSYQYFPPHTVGNVESNSMNINNINSNDDKKDFGYDNNSNDNSSNDYSSSNNNDDDVEDNDGNRSEKHRRVRDSLEKLSEGRSRTLSFELKAFTSPLGTLKGIETDDYSEMVAPIPTQCKCKKSQCLKLYCDCFALLQLCNEKCRCSDCRNDLLNEETRQTAIQITMQRTPTAFKNKVTPHTAHVAGCHCAKSNCLKKYCECFLGGAVCGVNCRCQSCKNFQGSEDLKNARKVVNKVGTLALQAAAQSYSNSNVSKLSIFTQSEEKSPLQTGGLMVSPNFASDSENRRFVSQRDVTVNVASVHGDALKRVEISDSYRQEEISDSKRRKEISDMEIREDEIREEWSEMNIRYPRARMIVGRRAGHMQEPGSDSRPGPDSEPGRDSNSGPDSSTGPSFWPGSNNSTNQSTNQSNGGHFSGQNQKKSHSFQPSNNELKFNNSMTENFQYGHANYANMMYNNTMPAPAPRLLRKCSYNETDTRYNNEHKINNDNDFKMVKSSLADISVVDLEKKHGTYTKISDEMMKTELSGMCNTDESTDVAKWRGMLRYEECERDHDTQLKVKLSRLNLELSASSFSSSIIECPSTRNASQSNNIYESVSSLQSYKSLIPDENNVPIRRPIPYPTLSTVSSDSVECSMRNIDLYPGLGSPSVHSNQFTYVPQCERSFDLFPEVSSSHADYVYSAFPIDNVSHPYVSSDFRSIYDDCMYVQHSGSPKRSEKLPLSSESDPHSENSKKRKMNTRGTNVMNPFNETELCASELIVSNVIKWLNLTDIRSVNCLNRCTGKKPKI